MRRVMLQQHRLRSQNREPFFELNRMGRLDNRPIVARQLGRMIPVNRWQRGHIPSNQRRHLFETGFRTRPQPFTAFHGFEFGEDFHQGKRVDLNKQQKKESSEDKNINHDFLIRPKQEALYETVETTVTPSNSSGPLLSQIVQQPGAKFVNEASEVHRLLPLQINKGHRNLE